MELQELIEELEKELEDGDISYDEYEECLYELKEHYE